MTARPWDPEAAEEIAARYADKEGALLPLLHEIQHTFGCVPEAAVPIAAALPPTV